MCVCVCTWLCVCVRDVWLVDWLVERSCVMCVGMDVHVFEAYVCVVTP